jgi:phosphate uptake regulator
MKRRVILLAGKTAVLSLPIKWVRQCGIKKGDELEIDENGSVLTVSSNLKGNEAPVEINISDMNSSLIWRYLNTTYKLGASEIKILYDDQEVYNPDKKRKIKTMDLIREIVNELIGLEIIKQGNNFCILKEISSVKGEEFDPVYRRIFLTLLNLAKDSLDAIRNKDKNGLENIIKYLDPNINKLFKFCLRIISKENNYIKDVMSKTIILHGLERIGDLYSEISRMLLNNKNIKINNETLRIYNDVNNLLGEFYEIYYKKDNKKIETLHMKAKNIKEEIMNSKSSDEGVLIVLKEINNQLREMIDWILPL